MNNTILIVDDEKDIVEFLEYNLRNEGFKVITAHDGEEALTKLPEKPDLIILDVLMPKLDGYATCERIRELPEFKKTPVLFLTAKSSETDEVKGLNLGADDYIIKPISIKKLVARVKSNLRKAGSLIGGNIKIGPLVIDRDQYVVKLEGESIILPKKEFEILAYLASQPGKVFPRERILSDVWGNDVFVVERTIDVHVRKIREKLNDFADLIETVKGVGYRFKNVE